MLTSLMFYLRTTGSEPCAEMDPELFFDDAKHQGAVTGPWLRALCESCPIFTECGDHALRFEEYGYWGGMSAADRRRERVVRGVALEPPAVVNATMVAAKRDEQDRRARHFKSLLSEG